MCCGEVSVHNAVIGMAYCVFVMAIVTSFAAQTKCAQSLRPLCDGMSEEH